jgi:hypothetical protein
MAALQAQHPGENLQSYSIMRLVEGDGGLLIGEVWGLLIGEVWGLLIVEIWGLLIGEC